MDSLTYKKTYERIKQISKQVPEELDALEYLNSMMDGIDDEIERLNLEIYDQFETRSLDEVYEGIKADYIEVDENLENWLNDILDSNGIYNGFDFEEICNYLDFIKNKEKKEKAIILLRNIIDGPDIELYRATKEFYDYLQEELENDIENSPEILKIKRKELLNLMRETFIRLEPTEIFYLDQNDKVDANQHSIYLGLRDVSEDMVAEDFERIFKEIYSRITNPYTKIGMSMLYLSRVEDIAINNPEYVPDMKLIEEMIPYLALKTCMDESKETGMMYGAVSNELVHSSNVWDGVYFINFYIQEGAIDKQLYSFILELVQNKNIQLKNVEFIEKLANAQEDDAVRYALDNILGDFIRNKSEESANEDISDSLFVAMVLNSLNINQNNFNEKAKEFLDKNKEKNSWSQKDLFDVFSLMLYIERLPEKDHTRNNELKDVSSEWINYYTESKNFGELSSRVEDIFYEEMQREVSDKDKKLSDSEIENEMFENAQSFYHEYVASIVLAELSKRTESQIYKYEDSLRERGIDTDVYVYYLMNQENVKNNFDNVMSSLSGNKQVWLKILSDSGKGPTNREIDCTVILPYIFSMTNLDNIKQSIEILYNLLSGDINHIYRNASELINFMSKEIESEAETLEPQEIHKRKLALLKLISFLCEDLKYVEDNENSFFHTVLLTEDEVREHGKYFALGKLIGKVPPEQFDKVYEQIFSNTSSSNVRMGLELLYLYNTEKELYSNNRFAPDVEKIANKLPTLLMQSYLIEKLPIQFYKKGAFTSGFKENLECVSKNILFSNYLANYGVGKDFYNILLNRGVIKGVDLNAVECIRKFGTLGDRKGENAEFYRKYIKEFFGDFIDKKSRILFPERPEEEYSQKEDPLADAYIAMILNTSQYSEDQILPSLSRIGKLCRKKNITSEELFEIGSILTYIESNVSGNIDGNLALTSLGENWIECYLDGGKVPENMVTNIEELQGKIGPKKDDIEK